MFLCLCKPFPTPLVQCLELSQPSILLFVVCPFAFAFVSLLRHLSKRLKHILRLPECHFMVIPTWTEDEIMKIEAKVERTIVKSRFKRMRGVPGWLCDEPEGVSEWRQEQQIRNLSFESLAKFVTQTALGSASSQGDRTNNGQSTDLILRIEPVPDDTTRGEIRTVITSEYVERSLAARFLEARGFHVHDLIAATLPCSSLAHFRGYALEEHAHWSFSNGRNSTMCVKRLSVFDGRPVNESYSSPRIMQGFKQAQKYVRIGEGDVIVNEYRRPEAKDEPTLDSWAVVDRDYVAFHFPEEPSLSKFAHKYWLICFQMTISEEHVVDGTVLNRLVKWLKTKFPEEPEFPIVFVFVTRTSTCIATMQSHGR